MRHLNGKKLKKGIFVAIVLFDMIQIHLLCSSRGPGHLVTLVQRTSPLKLQGQFQFNFIYSVQVKKKVKFIYI